MNQPTITFLGTSASMLSIVSLLPQVIRTWRTRSAGDISALWLSVALLSMFMWICYGMMIDAHAVVWANALTAIQVGFILLIKLRSDRSVAAAAATLQSPPAP